MEEENTFMLPPPESVVVSVDYEHVKHEEVIFWVKNDTGHVLDVRHSNDVSIDEVRSAVEFWGKSRQIRRELTVHVTNTNGLKLCTFKVPSW